MIMNKLTKKEALAVEYYLQGDNKTEAVMKAYECRTRDSARSLGARVFSKPKVSTELAERQKLLQQKLVDNNLKFIDLLEKYAPKDAIAKQMAENILSNDKRVSSTAIDQYLKIRGEYAPARVIEAKFEAENKNEDQVIVVLK